MTSTEEQATWQPYDGGPGQLTGSEIVALGHLTDFFNQVARHVVGNGRTRNGDLAEIASHVHALQAVIMAQAAARSYPEHFRLLGESLHEARSTADAVDPPEARS